MAVRSLTHCAEFNLRRYDAAGQIWKRTHKGSFADPGYASAPEGGSTFLYLGLAALMMFTAFFCGSNSHFTKERIFVIRLSLIKAERASG